MVNLITTLKERWEREVMALGLIPTHYDENPDNRRVMKITNRDGHSNDRDAIALQTWYRKVHSLTGINAFPTQIIEENGRPTGLEMQYLGNSNLADFLQSHSAQTELEPVLDDIARQIVVLIDNHLPHGDLQPANVVIYNGAAYFVDPSPLLSREKGRFTDVKILYRNLIDKAEEVRALYVNMVLCYAYRHLPQPQLTHLTRLLI